MKKEVTVSTEFVKAAYKSACGEWQKKIREELPEIFNSKKGEWKTNPRHGSCLVFIPNDKEQLLTIAIHENDRGLPEDDVLTGEYHWTNCDTQDYKEASPERIISDLTRVLLAGNKPN